MKTILACAGSLLIATALQAENVSIVPADPGGAFPMVSTDGAAATFVVDAADAQVVTTVAEAVGEDIKLVTGVKPALATEVAGAEYAVIAGTVGQSDLIDNLAAAGKIDVAEVAGKWEAYGLALVDAPMEGVKRALVAFGSNPRGTAYALFELSRLMGVSPYVWWADVAPEHRDALYATGTATLVGEPSVKWRGIFINDEDWGLTPWARTTLDAAYNNIGPNTYAKVMELLLRLRANLLWPAMHNCSEAFWANKDNLPVAKKYDIALGSSHCEQMLRDNEWEWHRWGDKTGNNDNWNYVTNKDKVQQYWEERVIESKGYSAMYTLGMRGVHDWGISGYPSDQDKVRGLTEIIDFQRSLIQKHIGDPTTVPQIFIPYKEVLDAYNAGLKVPEDVTLTWVDDNHGYIRQLPTTSEQARSGGNGIYYHLSYLGTPASYLWICSTSPSLISYELTKGYEYGIQDLWVINVGDIKPAEMELEFCMDLAWDVDAWTPENAWKYNRHWAAKTFGEECADELADIKLEYYTLANAGKPEHIFKINYNNTEMNERIERYAALAARAEALAARVPDRLRDAFYQMVEYPVKGAYYMNLRTFRARQSVELASAGHRQEAMDYAAQARMAHRMIGEITNRYNNEVSGGKWKGIMSSKPNGGTQFDMPETATASSVASYETDIPADDYTVVPASAYTASKGSFKSMRNLGLGEGGLVVWPMDTKTYTIRQIDSAPYLEYEVPVKAGENTIQARFLPTFPIHSSSSMNVTMYVADNRTTVSLKTTAMEGKWNTTVLQGFNDATYTYNAPEDGTVKVKVCMMNPGIVLNEIYVSHPVKPVLTLTDQLMVNPDFEYDANGKLNSSGATSRGVPMGWTTTGTLLGNSYGINNDGTNIHGKNLCWMNSFPMPESFELSQTIPSEKIAEGDYTVRCLLWVEENKKANCRLFANNEVQYYGYESDYTKILTPGENNTYAGYAGGQVSTCVLREMSVRVHVGAGESLKVGIRSSNIRKDGTRDTSGQTGWFKVDHFRIEPASEADVEEDLTLTKELITNYDFELYRDTDGTVKENTSGTTRRYTPYGWSLKGSLAGNSYGINNDVSNPHGANGCWFLSKDGLMSNDLELYQTIPAEKLTPGRYVIYCKLWAKEGHLGTVRLFANNNVQYYGMEMDYDRNLTPGEVNTFAGYIGGSTGNYVLQDMEVYVDVAAGEDLTLGIRSGNMNADGSEGCSDCGWFKTDYFRIHRAKQTGVDTAPSADPIADGAVYDLFGRRVADSLSELDRLMPGIYICNGRKFTKK